MAQNERLGTALIALSAFGFSILPVFLHQLTLNGVPPLDVVTIRFALAIPLLWLVVTLRRAKPSGTPMPRRNLMLVGTLYTGASVTGFFGLTMLPTSVYILIFYSYPAMVALISVAMGERLNLQTWIALGLTLVGVALTAPNLGAGVGAGTNTIGVVVSLINAVLIAVYFVMNNRVFRGQKDTLRGSAWLLTGTLLPLLIAAPFRTVILPSTPVAWVSLLALVVFSTLVPIVGVAFGIQMLGPSRAAILAMLEPILTIIFAAIFLGDRVTPPQAVGGVLILVSLILLNLRRSTPIVEVPS